MMASPSSVKDKQRRRWTPDRAASAIGAGTLPGQRAQVGAAVAVAFEADAREEQ